MSAATATRPKPSPTPPPQLSTDTRNLNGEVAAWLDHCEDEILHPDLVADRLVRAGWSRSGAMVVGDCYRSRFDEHKLGYSALLFATGFSALAAGTLGHLLCAGFDNPVNRGAVANWLTVLVCSLPFAGWAHWWAAHVDRNDPVAVWSKTRSTLARTLLWGAGIVGVARLMIYVYELNRTLVGAPGWAGRSLVGGFLNVIVTVSIALPVGVWAFRFLHRFDDLDPTAPRTPARSA
jgi:hypothetical protein